MTHAQAILAHLADQDLLRLRFLSPYVGVTTSKGLRSPVEGEAHFVPADQALPLIRLGVARRIRGGNRRNVDPVTGAARPGGGVSPIRATVLEGDRLQLNPDAPHQEGDGCWCMPDVLEDGTVIHKKLEMNQ